MADTADSPPTEPLPDRAPPDRTTAPQSPATSRQIAMGAAIATLIVLVIVTLVVVL